MDFSQVGDEEVIDLRKLFWVFWSGKWLIGGVTFVATAVAVIFALLLPNIYRAEALLVPNQDDPNSNASALAAQYGGLASLAGVNVGNGAPDRTALGLEILKSRKFISEFVERHDILVPLMATTGWNSKTGALKVDAGIYDESAGEWVREARPPRSKSPSLQEAYEKFRSTNLFVSQDDKTGFVTVAVEHYSPTVAQQWVEWLVRDLNATVMRQDVEQAEQAIKYLEDQVAGTALAELQNVFFRLIEEQTKTVMLAKVSPEYMFRTIDPAVVPELKAKPKRSVIALIGMLLGGLIGVVAVLVTRNNRVKTAASGSA